jgi:hypothetical protein
VWSLVESLREAAFDAVVQRHLVVEGCLQRRASHPDHHAKID